MLAQYGARMRPSPRPLPEATARTLQELLARHRQLTKMLVEEKNRRHQASALLRPGVEAHIAWLEDNAPRSTACWKASSPATRRAGPVEVLDSAPIGS